MTLQNDGTCAHEAFNKLFVISHRLNDINLSLPRALIEDRYESLLTQLYDNLLDLDRLLEKSTSPANPAADRFRGLLRTARQLDELWDAYHAKKLDLDRFSDCLKSTQV